MNRIRKSIISDSKDSNIVDKRKKPTTIDDINKRLEGDIMDVPEHIINDMNGFDNNMYQRYGQLYYKIKDKIPVHYIHELNRFAYVVQKAMDRAGVPMDWYNRMTFDNLELMRLIDNLVYLESEKQKEKEI